MKILVTGGPTREFLDRVRFLSNPSTGLMGDALAREAIARGHTPLLVRGPCPGPPPDGVETVSVETTEEMRRACLEHWPRFDAVIMAANPCDYRPSERHPGKLQRECVGEKVILTLVKTPDILFEMSLVKRPDQRMIGIAIDVDDRERKACEKLERKSLDLVVVTPPESLGRESVNLAAVFGREGRLAELRGSKRDVARGIIEALERLGGAGS